jgi:hypothetical protein
MERNKQIQIGLLAVVGLLLIANLFGGGFKSWLNMSEADKIREKAASSMVGSQPAETTSAGQAIDGAGSTSGNIPGTNVNATPQPTGPTTTIKYDNDKFEFGVVDEGEVVKHVFKFTNTGSEPLLITNARGSCGCTVPTWPHEPVAPGATGEIKVEFNTKGKPGNQSKRVTVTANTVPTETYIEVAGEVRGKDGTAKGG